MQHINLQQISRVWINLIFQIILLFWNFEQHLISYYSSDARDYNEYMKKNDFTKVLNVFHTTYACLNYILYQLLYFWQIT